MLSAPVAASADRVEPGNHPSETDGEKIRPHWGVPAPDALRSTYAQRCSGHSQPGTRDLLNYVEHWWSRGESWGIYSCRLPSLHSEGRALDYHLDVRNKRDRKAGYAISRFLRSRDSAGNRWAMARRFGIQEIIFDCKVWGAAKARQGWRPYFQCDNPGANRTARHEDHIHLGQNWRGATRRTTAWSGYHYCADCAGPPAGAFLYESRLGLAP